MCCSLSARLGLSTVPWIISTFWLNAFPYPVLCSHLGDSPGGSSHWGCFHRPTDHCPIVHSFLSGLYLPASCFPGCCTLPLSPLLRNWAICVLRPQQRAATWCLLKMKHPIFTQRSSYIETWTFCLKTVSYLTQGTSVKSARANILFCSNSCSEPEWAFTCTVPHETKLQFSFFTKSESKSNPKSISEEERKR